MKNVDVIATAKLALMRLIASGFVLGIFASIADPQMRSLIQFLTWPIVVFLFVTISFPFAKLAKSFGLPMVWIIDLFGYLTAIGDPILWVFSRANPNILPTKSFGLINRPIMIINSAEH